MNNKIDFTLALDTEDNEAVFIGIKKDGAIDDYVELDEVGVLQTIKILSEWIDVRQNAVYHTATKTLQ